MNDEGRMAVSRECRERAGSGVYLVRGEDGYGLGEQLPPFPTRSAKHCSNVV